MYGILGEDSSDVRMLSVMVRRLAGNQKMPIKLKGYGGCGELLRQGTGQLKAFAELGCTRLIVCYDADGPEHESRRQQLMDTVVRPSGLQDICCAVIPVQEIEAWIIADIAAVSHIFTSWKPPQSQETPSTFQSPKSIYNA